MDLKRIKELIDLFANSDLAELNMREGDCQLHLARRSHPASVAKRGIRSSESAAAPQATANAEASTEYRASAGPTVSSDTPDGMRDARDILAPMHGVFHLSPNPGAPPFVNVGDQVHAGQTLGVLEAMKVFHSVKCEVDGIVAAVLVPSGDEVSAGQPLFRIA